VTGPEHYREAEHLVAGRMDRYGDIHPARDADIAAARVHATLALAAATIDAAGYTSAEIRNEAAWTEALS
jgi:hypothetical protein